MNTTERLALARTSLLGLAVGDAFGETFFGKENEIIDRINNRALQPGPWLFTDDTVMSIGIYNVLQQKGKIDQDLLAKTFADNYSLDTYRGYGGTAHSILRSIAEGYAWKPVATAVFDDMGSMGNGAAMRAAITGAYFWDDTPGLIEQTTLTAEVTHSNPEAIAGAIAIALAASYAIQVNHQQQAPTPTAFFDFILANTPESDTRSGISKASKLPADYDIRTIVAALGNGVKLTAQDTVPLAVWCAAHHLADYENALWKAVSALGDRDTICAIVGSILVLSAGVDSIPKQWINQTEPFETSSFFHQLHT